MEAAANGPGFYIAIVDADASVSRVGYVPESETWESLGALYTAPASFVVTDTDANALGDVLVCLTPSAGSKKPCEVVLQSADGSQQTIAPSPNVAQTRITYMSNTGRTAAWTDTDEEVSGDAAFTTLTLWNAETGTTKTVTWKKFLQSISPIGEWGNEVVKVSAPFFSGESFILPIKYGAHLNGDSSIALVTVRADGSVTSKSAPRLAGEFNDNAGLDTLGNGRGHYRLTNPLVRADQAFLRINPNGSLTRIAYPHGRDTIGEPLIVGLDTDRLFAYRVKVTHPSDVDGNDTFEGCYQVINAVSGDITREKCSPDYLTPTGAGEDPASATLATAMSDGLGSVDIMWGDISQAGTMVEAMNPKILDLRINADSGASEIVHTIAP